MRGAIKEYEPPEVFIVALGNFEYGLKLKKQTRIDAKLDNFAGKKHYKIKRL